MNKSVLGADLDVEIKKVFIAKIGLLISQKDKLTNRSDRDFVSDVENEIRDKQGSFEPSPDQFRRLTAIYEGVSPAPVNKDMVDRLVVAANTIIRNGRLHSGRMSILVKIVEKYDLGMEITRQDENMLHFLVLEGTDYEDRS